MKKNTPKYISISNDFRKKIKSKFYAPGDLLPDYRTLRKELNCSFPTILKAFNILEREGHVRKIQGSGVYVDNGGAQEEISPKIDFENLTVIGIASGATIENHSTKLIEHHIVNAILNNKDKNRKFEPLRISHISALDLKAKLSYYRDILNGLIISGTNFEKFADCLQYALKQNIPTVFAGLQIPSQLKKVTVDTVYVDEFKGAYDAGRYFIEKGHTEIGFIYDYHNSKLGRVEGFITALKESGLKAHVPLDVSKDLNGYVQGSLPFHQKIGANCTKRMMEGKNRPTAIICVNDLCAVGAFEELKHMKITMPDEVELFGFADDIESRLLFSNRTNPISTVALPRKTLAEESCKLLVRRMNNPGLPTQIVTLPTTILHRKTTKGGKI